MPGRTLALGDIHGCARALDALLDAIAPGADDELVTLGDYVDRGPESRRAIDLLLDVAATCRLVPLLGNHDVMLLRMALGKGYMLKDWMALGGAATLASFGVSSAQEIPRRYLDFLRSCRPAYESPTHLFLHANYLPDRPLNEQPDYVLRWESLRHRTPGPHASGKIAILGHTAQRSGEPLDLGHLKCIDTCCYGGQWLTALDVTGGAVLQANPEGRVRCYPFPGT